MSGDLEGLGMTLVTQKCAMFGCREEYYQTLAIAPATVVNLCFKHFVEEGGVVEDGKDNKTLFPAGPAGPANPRA